MLHGLLLFLLLLDDAAPGEAMAPVVPSRAPAPPLTPVGTAPADKAPAVAELTPPTPPPERTEEGGMTMPALAVVVAMDVVGLRATPMSTKWSMVDPDAVSFEAEDSMIESIIERNLSREKRLSLFYQRPNLAAGNDEFLFAILITREFV